MIGDEFTDVLRAAQKGSAHAFARLWRDTNPLLVRYLSVADTGDLTRHAHASWATVASGFPGFRGDEVSWRSWVLATARHLLEADGSLQDWAAVVSAPAEAADPSFEAPTDDELDNRELDLTLAALAALPLGQGEILVLRLGCALPVETVAHVVRSDAPTVRALEGRALERLETDADLIAWSLAAPPRPAELADEAAGVNALARAIPAASGRHGPSRTATVVPLSRTALVVAAAGSAVVLGSMSAAAYSGALPDPVQNVLHRVIGVPSGDEDGRGTPPGSGAPSGRPAQPGLEPAGGPLRVGAVPGSLSTKPPVGRPAQDVPSPADGVPVPTRSADGRPADTSSTSSPPTSPTASKTHKANKTTTPGKQNGSKKPGPSSTQTAVPPVGETGSATPSLPSPSGTPAPGAAKRHAPTGASGANGGSGASGANGGSGGNGATGATGAAAGAAGPVERGPGGGG